ncbi:MAG: hypothetical protein A2Y53_00085 [Chloroflexi bacterium RBG_16_47_49]|nr:MAG: hypothetical protein A2Y53_00085 [Chloroflexi bacterium RBG_16_47_49]
MSSIRRYDVLDMPDGMITIDSNSAIRLGFVSALFDTDSYLWKDDNAIYISFITSKYPGRGNLSALFNRIWELGFVVKVPTPFAHMEQILTAKGFQRTFEDGDMGECEVWIK